MFYKINSTKNPPRILPTKSAIISLRSIEPPLMKSATSFSTPISRVPIIPHTAETKTVPPVVVLRKIHEITITKIALIDA